jgi:cbb3-type cytochrome c oxidase subunit III
MTATMRLACLLALFPASMALANGSAEAGAAKAAACSACHGAPGANSLMGEYPNLAGQNAAYIERQLHLMHDGKRTAREGDAMSAMMAPMAATLSDQDIADVAAYYATLVPAGLEADAAYWQAGQRLYRAGDRERGIPACAACHGPVGRGNPAAGYPALRAQQAMYLVKQLKAYGADTRYTHNEKGVSNGGDVGQIMRSIATRLTENDMRDLAAYVEGMR